MAVDQDGLGGSIPAPAAKARAFECLRLRVHCRAVKKSRIVHSEEITDGELVRRLIAWLLP